MAVDAASPAATTIVEIAAIDGIGPASGRETGYAYDAANRIIGGGVEDGAFHAYDPLARTWTRGTVVRRDPRGPASGAAPPAARDLVDVSDRDRAHVSSRSSRSPTSCTSCRLCRTASRFETARTPTCCSYCKIGPATTQIPAKLYEYLRIGQPVLALTDAGGDTAAVLRDTGGATVVDLKDEDAIFQMLPPFLEAVRAGRHEHPDPAVAARYARHNQARELPRCLDVASGHAPTGARVVATPAARS